MKGITNIEVEFERKYGLILSKFGDGLSTKQIAIHYDTPDEFKKLQREISIGDIYYREFYSDLNAEIVSVHCKMAKNAMIKTHQHPNADEYIYVIQGSIVNHLRGNGDIIVAPENQDSIKELMKDRNVHTWYKIPAGELHMLQALEPNTHIIKKFVILE